MKDWTTCPIIGSLFCIKPKKVMVQLCLNRDLFMIPWLEKLIQANKKVFLITNSPFEIVDAGMAFALCPVFFENIMLLNNRMLFCYLGRSLVDSIPPNKTQKGNIQCFQEYIERVSHSGQEHNVYNTGAGDWLVMTQKGKGGFSMFSQLKGKLVNLLNMVPKNKGTFRGYWFTWWWILGNNLVD